MSAYITSTYREHQTNDSNNELKIDDLTFNADGDVLSDESSIGEKPIELAGLTGLRIVKNGGFSNDLENIKTVLGPKPSGLLLNRVEKSQAVGQLLIIILDLENYSS